MRQPVYPPMNFGGLAKPEFSNFETARIFIWPVFFNETVSDGTEAGPLAIIDASRQLELFEEETGSEVYRIGIHTLDPFRLPENSEKILPGLYEQTREFLQTGKFLCLLGADHSLSAPVIRAHAEKFYNLSVLQFDAYAGLQNKSDETRHSHSPVMRQVVKDWRIPSVQIGIRSISANEVCLLDDGLPTRIFWAKDIAGRTDWIEQAVDSLTENVYLTIDVNGFDPTLVTTAGTPEPGGLGWSETIALFRRLAEKKRVVGMDLVEFSNTGDSPAPAYFCAKLIYKTLAFIFREDTPKVLGEKIFDAPSN